MIINIIQLNISISISIYHNKSHGIFFNSSSFTIFNLIEGNINNNILHYFKWNHDIGILQIEPYLSSNLLFIRTKNRFFVWNIITEKNIYEQSIPYLCDIQLSKKYLFACSNRKIYLIKMYNFQVLTTFELKRDITENCCSILWNPQTYKTSIAFSCYGSVGEITFWQGSQMLTFSHQNDAIILIKQKQYHSKHLTFSLTKTNICIYKICDKSSTESEENIKLIHKINFDIGITALNSFSTDKSLSQLFLCINDGKIIIIQIDDTKKSQKYKVIHINHCVSCVKKNSNILYILRDGSIGTLKNNVL